MTINSDDVLIFDSDVSKEYLRLYKSGCLTAEELGLNKAERIKEKVRNSYHPLFSKESIIDIMLK